MEQLIKQILEQQNETKVQHKMSDVFLNATEQQCSLHFHKRDAEGNESYCAIGLLGLYSGYEY